MVLGISKLLWAICSRVVFTASSWHDEISGEYYGITYTCIYNESGLDIPHHCSTHGHQLMHVKDVYPG